MKEINIDARVYVEDEEIRNIIIKKFPNTGILSDGVVQLLTNSIEDVIYLAKFIEVASEDKRLTLEYKEG